MAALAVFSAEIAFILDTLGSGEQAGIDRCGTDRGTDLAHGFPHGVEKGAAGVLHEMPTVGDLGGVRQRLGCGQRVAAAAVTGDNGDLGLAGEPSLGRRRLAIRQQSDRSCVAPGRR